MKKVLGSIVVVIIVLAGVWYVASTAQKDTALNDPSPLGPAVNDALETMTPERRTAFDDAVTAMEDSIVEMLDAMPTQAQLLAQGQFKRRAHGVSGQALFIKHDGQATLRFEDFDTINGPAIRIYLSSSLGISDAIDLGPIRATKGNVNYEVDPSIDISIYNKVLVWCEPFSVLFSYAELQ
ncbi:hypothetical protein CL628_04125 [bacterium]|nr:hypothetical protein [bacterium]